MAGRLVALAAAVLVLAACGEGGAGEGVSVAASPMVLADTSPRHLNLGVYIAIGGYDVQSRDTATVDVSLTSGGRPVKFVAGEMLTCDGTGLQRFIGGFETSLTVDGLAGRPVACTYTWPRGSAKVTFAAPPALRILTPREDDAVLRGTATAVTFSAAQGPPPTVGAFNPDAKAFAPPGGVSAGGAILDTTRLHAGPGTILLTQQVDLAGLAAPGFSSVSGHAYLISVIEVDWL